MSLFFCMVLGSVLISFVYMQLSSFPSITYRRGCLPSFVKDKVTIGTQVYLWAFYLVPLFCIYVFDCYVANHPKTSWHPSTTHSHGSDWLVWARCFLVDSLLCRCCQMSAEAAIIRRLNWDEQTIWIASRVVSVCCLLAGRTAVNSSPLTAGEMLVFS